MVSDFKGVEIFYFGDVALWHKLAVLTDVLQQFATGVAFQMGDDTLFMTWGIYFVCHFAVQPNAALALISVAFTAEWGMVKFIQLRVLYVQSALQSANAIVQTPDGIFLVCKKECRTNIEMPVWS